MSTKSSNQGQHYPAKGSEPAATSATMGNHHYEELSFYHGAAKLALNAALSPLDNAKVLMQIGFEPLPPRPTKTLFGRPALGLPNVFTYMSYMRKRDGFWGLYRGCTARMACQVVSGVTFHQVTSRITFQRCSHRRKTGCDGKREEDLNEEELRKLFMMATLRDLGGRLACIIITQPLFVVKTRTVAQFVGQEVEHSGVLASLRAIYNENGVLGYFSGLMPRLLGDLLSALLVASLTYVVNNYVVEDREFKAYTASFMAYIGSALTYPFHVVAACSAVSGSGLAAGSPPFMPLYSSWLDCWSDLKAGNQLKRGGSIFFRYYTGPQVLLGGRVVPVGNFPGSPDGLSRRL
ncbi:mitochondrial carrier homolog 2-like [Pollicipes pollicipes]|uniref:mitochondrial carrier homolog 2-like n=1 Tax=Pollicipes pollicipes TaxID=41117 RepID=UPI0018858693|nr:mitochondrial carrier homolog 2-like [Pollicipes pollicipes]